MSQSSWSRPARYLALILVLSFLCVALVRFRILFAPIGIAAFLAYLLSPLALIVHRRFIHSWHRAVLAVYLSVLLLMAGLIMALSPVVVRQIQLVNVELQTLVEQISNSAEITLFTFDLSVAQLVERFSAETAALLQPSQLFSVLRSVSTNATWVLVTLFCTFYFLRDGHTIKPKLVALTPPNLQTDVDRLIDLFIPVWRIYLRGQLLLMLIVGVASGVAAALLGIRSALVIGVLAGLLDIIPTVGPAIAGIIALGIATFEGSLWLPVPNSVIVLLLFVILGMIQMLENIWLRPQIMGNRLKLHPAVVFVVLIAALTFSGVFLALFVIPLLRTLQITLDYLRLRIYGVDPWAESELGSLLRQSK